MRKIDNLDEVDRITAELVGAISPTKENQKVFSHIISEAMNNVCQHSGAYGYSAAQYYPKTGMVRVCIADYGCGLRDALANHSPSNDVEAVRLALKVGVTGNPPQFGQPHMRNRGVGLSCIHRLTGVNDGKFYLWSGRGHLLEGAMQPTKSDIAWSGTLVDVMLRRDHVGSSFRDVIDQLRQELEGRNTQSRAGRTL